ncbi:hypothetical protein DIPPA_24792 [Diplonema papillatum]|nr:hypothetical protein DIPPA_24792 [Diplonema papillatum]
MPVSSRQQSLVGSAAARTQTGQSGLHGADDPQQQQQQPQEKVEQPDFPMRVTQTFEEGRTALAVGYCPTEGATSARFAVDGHDFYVKVSRKGGGVGVKLLCPKANAKHPVYAQAMVGLGSVDGRERRWKLLHSFFNRAHPWGRSVADVVTQEELDTEPIKKAFIATRAVPRVAAAPGPPPPTPNDDESAGPKPSTLSLRSQRSLKPAAAPEPPPAAPPQPTGPQVVPVPCFTVELLLRVNHVTEANDYKIVPLPKLPTRPPIEELANMLCGGTWFLRNTETMTADEATVAVKTPAWTFHNAMWSEAIPYSGEAMVYEFEVLVTHPSEEGFGSMRVGVAPRSRFARAGMEILDFAASVNQDGTCLVTAGGTRQLDKVSGNSATVVVRVDMHAKTIAFGMAKGTPPPAAEAQPDPPGDEPAPDAEAAEDADGAADGKKSKKKKKVTLPPPDTPPAADDAAAAAAAPEPAGAGEAEDEGEMVFCDPIPLPKEMVLEDLYPFVSLNYSGDSAAFVRGGVVPGQEEAAAGLLAKKARTVFFFADREESGELSAAHIAALAARTRNPAYAELRPGTRLTAFQAWCAARGTLDDDIRKVAARRFEPTPTNQAPPADGDAAAGEGKKEAGSPGRGTPSKKSGKPAEPAAVEPKEKADFADPALWDAAEREVFPEVKKVARVDPQGAPKTLREFLDVGLTEDQWFAAEIVGGKDKGEKKDGKQKPDWRDKRK